VALGLAHPHVRTGRSVSAADGQVLREQVPGRLCFTALVYPLIRVADPARRLAPRQAFPQRRQRRLQMLGPVKSKNADLPQDSALSQANCSLDFPGQLKENLLLFTYRQSIDGNSWIIDELKVFQSWRLQDPRGAHD
jgi:hypothetical protein